MPQSVKSVRRSTTTRSTRMAGGFSLDVYKERIARAQAGRDPAGLGLLARSLGFDGRQPEHFEVLSVPPLPHP